MRKKQFGKLLTISLSDECYSMVEKIANACQMSMGAVIRDAIMYSLNKKSALMESRQRPFDAGEMEQESPGLKDELEPKKNNEEDEKYE